MKGATGFQGRTGEPGLPGQSGVPGVKGKPDSAQNMSQKRKKGKLQSQFCMLNLLWCYLL